MPVQLEITFKVDWGVYSSSKQLIVVP